MSNVVHISSSHTDIKYHSSFIMAVFKTCKQQCTSSWRNLVINELQLFASKDRQQSSSQDLFLFLHLPDLWQQSSTFKCSFSRLLVDILSTVDGSARINHWDFDKVQYVRSPARITTLWTSHNMTLCMKPNYGQVLINNLQGHTMKSNSSPILTNWVSNTQTKTHFSGPNVTGGAAQQCTLVATFMCTCLFHSAYTVWVHHCDAT